jgi:hypothetical protein
VRDKERLFPRAFEFATAKGTATRELFGNKIAMLETLLDERDDVSSALVSVRGLHGSDHELNVEREASSGTASRHGSRRGTHGTVSAVRSPSRNQRERLTMLKRKLEFQSFCVRDRASDAGGGGVGGGRLSSGTSRQVEMALRLSACASTAEEEEEKEEEEEEEEGAASTEHGVEGRQEEAPTTTSSTTGGTAGEASRRARVGPVRGALRAEAREASDVAELGEQSDAEIDALRLSFSKEQLSAMSGGGAVQHSAGDASELGTCSATQQLGSGVVHEVSAQVRMSLGRVAVRRQFSSAAQPKVLRVNLAAIEFE